MSGPTNYELGWSRRVNYNKQGAEMLPSPPDSALTGRGGVYILCSALNWIQIVQPNDTEVWSVIENSRCRRGQREH